MKIIIQTPDKKIRIPLFNYLVFNRWGYYLLKKQGHFSMSYKEFKQLTTLLKKHKGLTFLEVTTQDYHVVIKV